ncbi:MAG: SAM-dependent methyltransferase [Bacteroidota bacterium]
MTPKLEKFIDDIAESFENQTFIKLTLSNYSGTEVDMKNIYVKPIKIKEEVKLSFTYRFKTKDIVKNYSEKEAVEALTKYIGIDAFNIANLFTTKSDVNLMINKTGKITINWVAASQKEIVSQSHDHQKIRKIDSKRHYLQELKITDSEGLVFKNAQDKYKQINHYIELLAPLLKEIPKHEQLKVVDMGSGKGYLTFALYDYLINSLKVDAEIVGVEFRPDLVELCNQIAENSGFEKLKFVQGSIADYSTPHFDILIALHACDTATDDAIFKGIEANAQLIVVAPCCHKQIRREMEKTKKKNELDFLTKHGIFLERQAEMATDGLRALLLEYSGYSVKVQQFISDAHTPKNVMITAIKKKVSEKKKAEILLKIKETKAFFGIGMHHLEQLLGL